MQEKAEKSSGGTQWNVLKAAFDSAADRHKISKTEIFPRSCISLTGANLRNFYAKHSKCLPIVLLCCSKTYYMFTQTSVEFVASERESANSPSGSVSGRGSQGSRQKEGFPMASVIACVRGTMGNTEYYQAKMPAREL